jgi:hypothetical protein
MMKCFYIVPLASAALLGGCASEKASPPIEHTVQRPVQPSPAERTHDDFGLPLKIDLKAPEVPSEVAAPSTSSWPKP